MNELPDGWAEARLDELLAPEPAAITDGPFGSNLKTEHYTTTGPRVIRLQNVGDGFFRDERAHISEERFETLKKHVARPGDIVIAALGEVLPRACVVPPGVGPAIVKADCIRVRLHPEVNTHFLNAMLNSPPVRHVATGDISGVGRPRLNLAKIRSIRVPVPPRGEQERIVAAIEEQFSRLEDANRLLRAAHQRAALLRSALLEAVTPVDGDFVPLGEIADLVGGVTKDSKRQGDPSYVEVPYLRVANVQRGYLDLAEIATIRVPPEKAKALRLETGDILFNEGGDRDKLGRGWVWSGEIEECIHQNHVFRARLLTTEFDPKFVSIHGNTFGRRWFEDMGKQTTNLASINLRTLKSFPIPVLPVEEQRQRVEEAERQITVLDALITAVEHAIVRSDHLRRAVLSEAFSGRLVPQDANDEPASELLARIAAERTDAPKPRRRPRA